MKQAIEKIIDFITTAVHPDNLVNLDLSEGGLTTILDATSSEVESVKSYLVANLFSLEKHSGVEFLVQNYQSVIIRLLDDLYAYQLNQGENKSVIKLYISLTTSLSAILFFIEKFFSKYFNIEENVPHHYCQINRKNFQSQFSKLKTESKEKSADLKLMSIIEVCYSPPTNDLNKITVTYRQLIYYKELLAELISISSDKQPSRF